MAKQDQGGSRADFHREHQARAEAEAQRLLAAREQWQGRWLAWVASELYRLSPPAYANMVRRELSRLSDAAES
jgi:hypothetical protein